MSEFRGYNLQEIITRIDRIPQRHVSLCATRKDGLWTVWVEWLQ